MNGMEAIEAIVISLVVACFLLNTGRGLKAIEICKECLIFLHAKAPEKEKQFVKSAYSAIYNTMFKAYRLMRDYAIAIKYGRELLAVNHELGEIALERNIAIELAKIYERQFKYAEARKLYEEVIDITKETGDRKRQAFAYGKLGTMSYYLGEYVKAKEYLETECAIRIEIGDREEEAISSTNLGTVFRCLGQCDKAKEYHEKALAIRIEIGDKAGEATDYGNLGNVFQSLGEYSTYPLIRTYFFRFSLNGFLCKWCLVEF